MSNELKGKTEEELLAAVDNISNAGADIQEKARKAREEEVEKQKVEEAKRQQNVDSWNESYAAIDLRKTRGIENAKKVALKSRSDENASYNAGGIETREHQKNLRKIDEDQSDAICKVERKFNEDFANLKVQNPSGYRASNNW